MKKIFGIIAMALVCSLSASAQKLEIRPYWASNWGATTSFGTPQETREIKSSKMYYNYVFGVDLTKMITDKWGVTTGLRFERKANGSSVVMKDYHTTIKLDQSSNAPTEGYFSGTVDNKNDNKYITMPILAVYRASEKWDIRGGLYFSYAVSRCYESLAYDGKIHEIDPTHRAVGVSHSENDYSYGVSKFDMGLQVGVVHPIWKNLDVNMDITWGLLNEFDAPETGMTMNVYNLYFNVGLGWRF